MGNLMIVSPYKLQGFQECPRWYFFEYLDEAIAPYKKELKKPRSYFTVGDCVHKAINHYFITAPAERTETGMLKILETVWEPYAGDRGGFKDGEEETRCFEEAKAMIQNFLEKQKEMPEPTYSPGIDRGQEMKKSEIEENLVLQGKIDRVDAGTDGLHIIDYKTSKAEETDPFQIFAYGLLSEAAFKEDVGRVSFWYLRSNHLQTFLFGSKEREETHQKIKEIVDVIRVEKDFAPKIGSRCYICDYVSFCPEKEKVMATLNKEKPAEKEIGNLPF